MAITTGAGHGGDVSFRPHAADALAPIVGNVNAAVRVHGDGVGKIQLGIRYRAAIATGIRRGAAISAGAGQGGDVSFRIHPADTVTVTGALRNIQRAVWGDGNSVGVCELGLGGRAAIIAGAATWVQGG